MGLKMKKNSLLLHITVISVTLKRKLFITHTPQAGLLDTLGGNPINVMLSEKD
jgi:hypothetical protein